jgi:hypothetical protein
VPISVLVIFVTIGYLIVAVEIALFYRFIARYSNGTAWFFCARMDFCPCVIAIEGLQIPIAIEVFWKAILVFIVCLPVAVVVNPIPTKFHDVISAFLKARNPFSIWGTHKHAILALVHVGTVARFRKFREIFVSKAIAIVV